jgi:GNAT superfamily N-acetyltransferase
MDLTFRKHKPIDLDQIYTILSQWNKNPYLDELFALVKLELQEKLKYNMQFFVLADDEQGKIVGFGGLVELMPQMRNYATTEKSCGIKSLYLNNSFRGQGIGKILLKELENEALKQGNLEIVLRSAEEFKDTAWDFYQHQGYEYIDTMKGEGGNSDMAVFRKIL